VLEEGKKIRLRRLEEEMGCLTERQVSKEQMPEQRLRQVEHRCQEEH
jgi:hypothetical protein